MIAYILVLLDKWGFAHCLENPANVCVYRCSLETSHQKETILCPTVNICVSPDENNLPIRLCRSSRTLE